MFRALLDNSIKYTPPDGEITIAAETRAGQIRIIVNDTGIGIPAEELENIFTRFYRVDKSRDKESGGSGLGLAIVKWIVDVHGGQIKAKSIVGTGTTIIIRFPDD
jgi:signal transduction histidine kinase